MVVSFYDGLWQRVREEFDGRTSNLSASGSQKEHSVALDLLNMTSSLYLKCRSATQA